MLINSSYSQFHIIPSVFELVVRNVNLRIQISGAYDTVGFVEKVVNVSVLQSQFLLVGRVWNCSYLFGQSTGNAILSSSTVQANVSSGISASGLFLSLIKASLLIRGCLL